MSVEIPVIKEEPSDSTCLKVVKIEDDAQSGDAEESILGCSWFPVESSGNALHMVSTELTESSPFHPEESLPEKQESPVCSPIHLPPIAAPRSDVQVVEVNVEHVTGSVTDKWYKLNGDSPGGIASDKGIRKSARKKPDVSHRASLECSICSLSFRSKSAISKHMKLEHYGGKPFKCPHCNKAYMFAVNLKHHMMCHLDEDAYKCRVCDVAFKWKPGLLKHMETVHSIMRPFECDICGKSFKVKYALERHLLCHEQQQRFECGTCGKVFLKEGELRRHEVCHVEEKPFKCEECGRKFKRKHTLVVHHNVHSEVKPFECKFCRKSFKRKYELLYHQTSHSTEKLFKCDSCGKAFKQKGTLYHHRKIHVDVKSFGCDLCDKAFRQKIDLARHQMMSLVVPVIKEEPLDSPFLEVVNGQDEVQAGDTEESILGCSWFPAESTGNALQVISAELTESSASHHEESLPEKEESHLESPVCGPSFKVKYALERHLLRHERKQRFECGTCGRMFPKENELRRHEVCHSEEKPFKCEECGKKFKRKSTLVLHHTIHSEVKPFECEFCKKSFKRKIELQYHHSTHSAEKPFACDTCGKAFKQKGHLWHHRKSHLVVKSFGCDLCDKAFKQKIDLVRHQVCHSELKPFSCEFCGEGKGEWDNPSVPSIFLRAEPSHELGEMSENPPEKFSEGEDSSNEEAEHPSLQSLEKDHLTQTSFHEVMGLLPTEESDPCVPEVVITCFFPDSDGESDSGSETRESSESKVRGRKPGLFHPTERPFSCSLCSAAFTQKAHLHDHLRCRHSSERPFRCHSCSRAFKLRAYLKKHLATIHGDKKFGKRCHIAKRKLCLARDVFRSDEEKDESSNSSSPEFITPDIPSEEVKMEESKLKNDTSKMKMEMVEPDSKEAVCEDPALEPYGLPPEKPRGRKPGAFDPAERPFRCESCDGAFKSKCHLQDHVRSVHLKERPFLCGICGHAFSIKGNLKKHLMGSHRWKSKEALLKASPAETKPVLRQRQQIGCDICKREFKSRSHLQDHFQSIHSDERPFKCQFCNLAFKLSGNLKKHLIYSHISPSKKETKVVAKSTFRFSCDICHRGFKCKNHLQDHVQSKHSTARPFKCHLCNYACKLRSNLKKHVILSHNSKSIPTLPPSKICGRKPGRFDPSKRPFKCDFCDCGFASSGHLDDHVRSRHSTERPFKCNTCGHGFKVKRNLRTHKRKCHPDEGVSKSR
ncbi:unnamed protein product [Darwinula stevensoni]|uniref:C2H2-type domain-containing protein n=1 Tax=Darwinula stevensoni TaxID=69355 RepID=A0A7R8X8J7_9CRUS|nr:unnamed protein product [Darwinula stevensoni]CAG0888162.1 unnamed protein product [Darwinula stevensoni]